MTHADPSPGGVRPPISAEFTPFARWGTALVTVALVTVLLAACGGSPSRTENRVLAPTAIPAPSGVDAAGVPFALNVLDGGDATGLVITNRAGMAVYGTAGETIDNLVCTESCASTWIPVQSEDGALPPELDAAKLGSFTRPDGSSQVTYAGVPLYTWTGDSQVGITGGAGVAGTWFALTEVGGFVG